MKKNSPLLFAGADSASGLSLPHDKGRREVNFTEDRQEVFLAAIANGYSVKNAAKAAGVGRRTVYDLKERDAEFAKAWEESLKEGIETVEDIVRQCANDPKHFLDRIAWLKAHHPEKWSEKNQGVSINTPNISITINVPPAEELPPELRQIVEEEVRMIEEHMEGV